PFYRRHVFWEDSTMKISRVRHGRAHSSVSQKLFRAGLLLLLALVAGAGLLISSRSLAKSDRQPLKRLPSTPVGASNDPASDSSKKDIVGSYQGEQKSSQRVDISPETMQQIAALESEKTSRTPIEQKIDSQLLQAIRESRGQQMATGVHLDRANVKADDAGRLEIDISTAVNDDLLSKIEGLGGEIIYPSWEYKTVRARVNLSVVEAIADLPEVRFVQPAVQYLLDLQRNANALSSLTGTPDFLAGAGFLARRSAPEV